ncbi:pseudouridylate synthase [Dyadobacter jejuensis]|uniref:pseudouridylate synthase n=1 Tax=Dyadobacter jejuensis TaxID=1082580 RepID=UPI00130480EC|nr:pseudouridylate synthase [Dyadobacter jejuensis]
MPYSTTTARAFISLPPSFRAPLEPKPSLFGLEPGPMALEASAHLQEYLLHQTELKHNFGLNRSAEPVIGKMFGVLVVQNSLAEWGYIAAFSGKLGGSNHHAHFVPPIFDGLQPDGFLNEGMLALTCMNKEIALLSKTQSSTSEERIKDLKEARKVHSNSLQNKIFDQYHFLNRQGQSRSLRDIFLQTHYRNPPVGAGECAAPKLFQYAFQHGLTPVSLAEFWWGQSPKSATWKHGNFYLPCKEKCEPILKYMLSGVPEAQLSI